MVVGSIPRLTGLYITPLHYLPRRQCFEQIPHHIIVYLKDRMSEPLAGGESRSLGICLDLRERGALQGNAGWSDGGASLSSRSIFGLSEAPSHGVLHRLRGRCTHVKICGGGCEVESFCPSNVVRRRIPTSLSGYAGMSEKRQYK